jgi:hypothetical protein
VVRKSFRETDMFDMLSRHPGVRFKDATEEAERVEPVATDELGAAEFRGLEPNA